MKYFGVTRIIQKKQNNIETYGQTPERIIDRYLQGMSQNMLDLVVSMSCLNYWTDDLVSYLRPEISGFSDITYKNFLSLSLVNKTEDRYYMHDIVKKLIITSMATTELVTRVKSKAASYYKEKLDEFADDIAINLAAFVSYSLAICTDETQCIALLKAIRAQWIY